MQGKKLTTIIVVVVILAAVIGGYFYLSKWKKESEAIKMMKQLYGIDITHQQLRDMQKQGGITPDAYSAWLKTLSGQNPGSLTPFPNDGGNGLEEESAEDIYNKIEEVDTPNDFAGNVNSAMKKILEEVFSGAKLASYSTNHFDMGFDAISYRVKRDITVKDINAIISSLKKNNFVVTASTSAAAGDMSSLEAANDSFRFNMSYTAGEGEQKIFLDVYPVEIESNE
jgi:uncharacterized protein YneF (UPF0154 family)